MHHSKPSSTSSPAFPIDAVSVDVGIGKTHMWRTLVVPPLLDKELSAVLTIPRHTLGDEVAGDLAPSGVDAAVYRGREAEDPDCPKEKMCRDLSRVKAIELALGDVAHGACKNGDQICEFYKTCGYQRQKEKKPKIWIIPHQLLFMQRAIFIPEPDSVTIDESFWGASLHGFDKPYSIRLSWLVERRTWPGPTTENSSRASVLLEDLSKRVHEILSKHNLGRIRLDFLREAGITALSAELAEIIEWERKEKVAVRPGQALTEVKNITKRVGAHNRRVAKLARFWLLLARSLASPFARSLWLELQEGEDSGDFVTIISMKWRDEIHPSWKAPTLILDATMPVKIVQKFYPTLNLADTASAPTPHTYVRQISDRPMTASMLIPTETANKRTNNTRLANIERIRRYLFVEASKVCGRILVVCQIGVEACLRSGELPDTVELAHFNAITGLNDWKDVGLVVIIGRTEPSPRTVESLARVIFEVEIEELQRDKNGEIRYPQVPLGIRMRDGLGYPVSGPRHPDPHAEAIRHAICEAELIQAIGRGRGVNRGPENPLRIDVLTNVVLPIEVDEVTTWGLIQPGLVDLMRSEGGILCTYADMAKAYSKLFPSAEAARKALKRELKNPGQMPIEKLLLGLCPGFSVQRYRRTKTGPAGTLLYNPARIEDPLAWLTERLGPVTLIDDPATNNEHQ